MKKIILLTLIISLLGFYSLSAAAKIKFKETTKDFGEVESGKVVDLAFEFENSGDALLVIKGINSSCGCTVAQLDKKEYKPGEKGVLPVKFNTRGYNGKVSKTITINTNDEATPHVTLTAAGTVALKDFATIELESDQINFEKVPLGKENSKKITFRNGGTIDLRVIEVTHSPDIIPEFDKKNVGPRGQGELTVRFKAMQAGRFTSFLKIRTNDLNQVMVIVRIAAEVE